MDSSSQGLEEFTQSNLSSNTTTWQNSLRLQNQGVPKPDGLTVLCADEATLWPHPKLLAKRVPTFHFNYCEPEHGFFS